MARGIVRFCYRKRIDTHSAIRWEKYLFEDTYKEFQMQAQQFDQEKKCKTFTEMLVNIMDADAMHYLVSTAAVNYIRQLKGNIPDLTNQYNKPFLTFKNFKFEIIESHINQKEKHSVLISFFSDPVIWIEPISNGYLLSAYEDYDKLMHKAMVDSYVLTNHPQVSICAFQETRHYDNRILSTDKKHESDFSITHNAHN